MRYSIVEFRKVISAITAMSLMVGVVGKDIAYAKEEVENRGSNVQEINKEIGDILDKGPVIASEYGKITSISDMGIGGKVIIGIQDLHSHEQTQRNIEKIIETLSEKYKVKEIFVEGGYGKVEAGWLNRIKNKGYRKKITEELLKEGKLSAGEYYALKNNKEGMIYGLEDEDKHKENIKRLGYILENQGRYKEELKKIERQIKYLVDKYTNMNARRFNNQIKKYRDNKIKPEKFYAILNKDIEVINGNWEKYSNILPIKKEEYPNIYKYKELLEKHLRINEKKVTIELEGLLKNLKGMLPYYGYKKLMEKTNNGKEVSLLCMYLKEICNRYSIDMSKEYRELEVFIRSNNIASQINPVEMVAEERRLIEKIRGAYAYDEMAGEIGFLEDFYGYFREYLSNKLMASDYDYFIDNIDKFKELYGKYAVENELVKMEKDFEVLNAYYNLNNDRNEIFVKNIMSVLGWNGEQEGNEQGFEKGSNIDSRKEGDLLSEEVKVKYDAQEGKEINSKLVEECLGRAKEAAIVISGGYHSIGLTKILNSKNISNIVITPCVIGDIKKAEKIYEGVIKDEVKILKEALNYTVISQMPEIERFKYFVNAGLEIINEIGYSREVIRQMVIAINECFGDGTAELVRLEDNVAMIRFVNGRDRGSIRIQKEEKGELAISEEGTLLETEVGKDEEGEESQERMEKEKEEGVWTGIKRFIGEEILSGKILDVKEQVKRFYRFAYEKGINGVLSTDGLIYELDEYRRREGVREIEGVDIEVISKMPKEVQEYLFAQVLGRSVDISRLGEKTRAVITAIVEIGHIFRASEDREYFEEFLGMHGKENEVRRAGLMGITEGVREALNDMGVSLGGRWSRAIEEAFNKHVEHNIAHPEAKLELREDAQAVLDKLDRGEGVNENDITKLITARKEMLKKPALLNGDDNERRDYKSFLLKIEEEIAFNINWTDANNNLLANFSAEEKEYFKILKMSVGIEKNIDRDDNITALQAIVSGLDNYDIKYRLYAFMQLQKAGVDVDIDTCKNLIGMTFKRIRNSSFKIGNAGTSNFDLRALTTGINLILTTTLRGALRNDFSVNETQMAGLYSKISKATFFPSGMDINHGWSTLDFSEEFLTNKTFYAIIAHELGHNYLELMGVNSYNSEMKKAFHEFFAYSVQGFFAYNINKWAGIVTRFMLTFLTVKGVTIFLSVMTALFVGSGLTALFVASSIFGLAIAFSVIFGIIGIIIIIILLITVFKRGTSSKPVKIILAVVFIGLAIICSLVGAAVLSVGFLIYGFFALGLILPIIILIGKSVYKSEPHLKGVRLLHDIGGKWMAGSNNYLEVIMLATRFLKKGEHNQANGYNEDDSLTQMQEKFVRFASEETRREIRTDLNGNVQLLSGIESKSSQVTTEQLDALQVLWRNLHQIANNLRNVSPLSPYLEESYNNLEQLIVAFLQSKIDSLPPNLADLQPQSDSLRRQATSLAQVQQFRTDLGQLQGDLQGRLQQFRTDLGQLQGDLQGRLQQFRTDLGQLQGDLQQLMPQSWNDLQQTLQRLNTAGLAEEEQEQLLLLAIRQVLFNLSERDVTQAQEQVQQLQNALAQLATDLGLGRLRNIFEQDQQMRPLLQVDLQTLWYDLQFPNNDPNNDLINIRDMVDIRRSQEEEDSDSYSSYFNSYFSSDSIHDMEEVLEGSGTLDFDFDFDPVDTSLSESRRGFNLDFDFDFDPVDTRDTFGSDLVDTRDTFGDLFNLVDSSDSGVLQLPILTRIYNFLGIGKEKRAKITAVIETPLIIMASIFRSFGEIFLRWHGKGDKEKREEGLGQIRQAVRMAWEETYSRIPGVNLCLRIYNAIKVNYEKHVEWNLKGGEKKKEMIVEEGVARAMLEYHEVRKGELEGEVREFGGEVRVGVNGDISMAVYIISEKPEEGEEYKFENSGVSIGGETLWIGEYKGAMAIYVEGGEIGEIGEEIRRNKKIKEKIRERIEASIKGKKVKEIEIEGIEVGMRGEEEEEGIRYSERGEIRVGYSEYREKVERGEELEFSGSLRAVKRAEGYTYARSIIHNLNDVEDVEGFKEYLKQHKKMGNGQIVVKESLVKKMIVEIRDIRVMEFLNEARKEGVEVYVMLEGEEREVGVKEYERLGFAGYVEGRELSNFALGSKVEVGEIGSFRDERELEERLREAKGMVLIENTELKKVIEESRTGLSIGELIGVLSNIKKAISIFRKRGISREHVERVVRNIEIKDMPEVEEEMMGKIKEMVRNKELMKIENLREALKISENGSDVISVYIGKVEKEVEGREDREDREEIMEALVRGIVERVLVAEALRRKGKELGLRDKNHEIMLGKALMAGVEMGIEYDKGEKGGIEEFVRGLKTEIEVEVKLNKELAELMERGIEGKEEGAVRKIIELIPEISEGRRKIEIREDMRPKMDIRSYSSILSAA